MRIGIYGGSFNPIHRGHTALATSLIRQGLVDEVWLMVSPQNPLKVGTSYQGLQPTYDQRLRMAMLATKDIKGVTCSDFERHLPLPSYTVTTLHELSRLHPQHQFSLIIGADNWLRFPRWYHADEILSTYPIILFLRPGYELTIHDSLPTIHDSQPTIVHTPLYDISSTQIRDLVRVQGSTAGLINKKVLQYIQKHHLYL